MLPLISPASNLATQINVSTVKRFNPFGKFDFQILMILFLPLAPLNTQFIFSKHVESVILLWKYFVPMQNHFCEISFHSENAQNKLTICLFLRSELLSHACTYLLCQASLPRCRIRSYLFSKPTLSRCDRPRCLIIRWHWCIRCPDLPRPRYGQCPAHSPGPGPSSRQVSKLSDQIQKKIILGWKQPPPICSHVFRVC